MGEILSAALKLVAELGGSFLGALGVNIGIMVISHSIFDCQKKEKPWGVCCIVLEIMFLAALVANDFLKWAPMLTGWAAFTAVITTLLFIYIIKGTLSTKPASEAEHLEKEDENSVSDSNSCNEFTQEEVAGALRALRAIYNIYECGAAQPANEICNHKLVCETAEIVKTTDARLCQLRDALILSESEYPMLSKESIRLHEEACAKFCKVCDDIRLFGENVWPRMRIAAKQFNLAKDAEQRDLALLQTVQEYLTTWNNTLDEISQLAVQMAETLLETEKQNCKNEDAAQKIGSELLHCRDLLLSIGSGLRHTPLHNDFTALAQLFYRIKPDDWDKEILSYSTMYLKLLRRSANEYQTKVSTEDMHDSIKNGIELLNMMWQDMLQKVKARDLAKLRAELQATENLAYVRGYVPGELNVAKEAEKKMTTNNFCPSYADPAKKFELRDCDGMIPMVYEVGEARRPIMDKGDLEDLFACPVFHEVNGYIVECPRCCKTTGVFVNVEDAVAAWNKGEVFETADLVPVSKVITLCGSTRFKDQFLEIQKQLTLEGHIVLSVGLFGHYGDNDAWDNKKMMDALHKRKIAMSDEIFVINVGGYIGDGTRSEIEFAERMGKTVRYLEEKKDG